MFRCRAVLLLVLALPQSACGAGWHRIEPAPPVTLRPRQQVQVWRGGTSLRLHAISLSSDTLSGVPYLQSPSCDSCRISLVRSSVDSMRAGNPTAGFWKTLGLSLAGLLVAALVICGTSTTCQLEAD